MADFIDLMPDGDEIKERDIQKAFELLKADFDRWERDFVAGNGFWLSLSPFTDPPNIFDRSIKYVYVSGPYSLGNVNQNVRTAIYTGDELAKRGYIPFIPHLSHLWDLVSAHDYQFWLDQDLQWLERCDCVFRLPGESAGADIEVKRAIELGLPVFYSWAELERYTNG